ncbi:MAG: DUF937 domain-containing protein [Chitinophagaceae bacterium]|nr:MAG: DUF937 domain-containing protein [Chitinophagaceae bacterium]
MAVNILETVKGYLTPDLISKASNMLGESESGVSKALSGLVPAVLGGLLSKATSGGHAGANEVLAQSKESYQSGFPGNLTNMLSGGLLTSGAGMLQNFLGNKMNGIISAISSFAGIKPSSSQALFNVAAPLSTGALGKYAAENNLDAGGMASFLQSQKASISSALPAGLGSILGLGGLGSNLSAPDVETSRHVTATLDENDSHQRKSNINWVAWLLLLAGVAALIWFLTKGNDNESNTATVPDTTATTQTTSSTNDAVVVPPASRESMMVKLPNGTELNAYRGGIEDQLVTFLQTNWMALGEDSLKNRWFDFDNLNFQTASAEITPESQQQVDNLSAILKAFPKAKLKIGGYTDKTGSEPANQKLSGDRAKAVQTALEKTGVGKQITGAEGYGSAYAKYSADAPESDRATDRRVSVSVRE